MATSPTQLKVWERKEHKNWNKFSLFCKIKLKININDWFLINATSSIFPKGKVKRTYSISISTPTKHSKQKISLSFSFCVSFPSYLTKALRALKKDPAIILWLHAAFKRAGWPMTSTKCNHHSGANNFRNPKISSFILSSSYKW